MLSRRAFHRSMAALLLSAAFPSFIFSGDRPTSVALLLSGVITDGGWSQLAYNGLKDT